ncbi:uncharacterized protein LOC129729144 [Wyeomyia smithii]|uniref:uncharacterized protein LOC129729144 n=1 Tax=Wyeomyia smithii TaxID=174621 RepID=UPI002467B7DC|nr:uncharacterized protein LOC129729144 [Wyeomyia smithii]
MNVENNNSTSNTNENETSADVTFTCQQLIQKYASSNADILELYALLSSWNVGDLFPYCCRQHLYVGVLRHLTPEMAISILNQPCIPLGAQVEFYHHWHNWMESARSTIDVEKAECSSQSITSKSSMNESNSAQQSRAMEAPLDLNTILKSNQYGLNLIAVFNRDKILNDNLRKLMLESILQFCIENKHDLTVKDCSVLAAQIVQVFPGEVMAYYFVERKNSAPLGKLYHKYRNWKSNLNRKSSLEKSTKSIVGNPSKTFTTEKDEEIHIRALRHEMATMSYDEKLAHWVGCAATRLNIIQNQNNPQSASKIFDLWPQFKNPDGYRMIEADFVFIHGQKKRIT